MSNLAKQFGVTKPKKAQRRALEGTSHAPKQKRDPGEAYKTALESTAYALKHQKDGRKAKYLQNAHDALTEAGKDVDNDAAAVAARALEKA